jgi:hypothetical protein
MFTKADGTRKPEVLFTKADVTRKPRGVTHQDRLHAEAWLSAWPRRVHITPEHSPSR